MCVTALGYVTSRYGLLTQVVEITLNRLNVLLRFYQMLPHTQLRVGEAWLSTIRTVFLVCHQYQIQLVSVAIFYDLFFQTNSASNTFVAHDFP